MASSSSSPNILAYKLSAHAQQAKVFGLVAWSGVGKTTLLEKLLTHYAEQGVRVSVIKHTHHQFDIDRPGKDSFRHREAGAHEVMLVSNQRWVLMHENRTEPEPPLAELLKHLSPCDLVLLEGYRQAAIPKLELWRAAHAEAAQRPLHAAGDAHILAVASDTPEALADRSPVPVLDLNDIPALAAFILAHAQLPALA